MNNVLKKYQKHFKEISEGKWKKNGIYCKKRTIKEDIQGCFLSLSLKTKYKSHLAKLK